ncbi:DJ-1/PfpI family protein [Trichoderma harzianum]|uniref:DJ-1/PfpI family protein n=1 Tax=Trichoderma harzianum TaxID=5544 RepID=A0A0F9Z9Q3_TRIHA|nr:DJ-1/PfpI family protein [Trichoderma harzianum]
MAPIVVGSLCYQYQASDVIAPFDMIAGGSKQLLEAIRTYSPDVTDLGIKNAPEFVFHHIDLSRDLVDLTAGTIIKPTCTVDDCPELDILLFGGPNPVSFDLNPRYAEIIRRHVAAGPGPVAGMDMMIHWLREKYGEESFRWAALNLDFEPRDNDGVNMVLFRYGADGK